MANHETTLPSRRAAMTALASAAALGTTMAAAATSPEAELLELGRQFRALLPVELAARAEATRLGEICDERLAELFPEYEQRARRRHLTDDEYEKYSAANKALRSETGKIEASKLWNQQHDAVERVALAIKATSASSLAGLLVKAEALVWLASSGFSRNDMPIDWSAYGASPLGLVEAIFAVAGEPVPAFIADEIEAERATFIEDDEA